MLFRALSSPEAGQRVLPVAAVLHEHDLVVGGPEAEHLGHVDHALEPRFADAEGHRHLIALLEDLADLEAPSLLSVLAQAVHDLLAVVSGGSLELCSVVDGPPHNLAIEEVVPRIEVPSTERLVRPTDEL